MWIWLGIHFTGEKFGLRHNLVFFADYSAMHIYFLANHQEESNSAALLFSIYVKLSRPFNMQCTSKGSDTLHVNLQRDIKGNGDGNTDQIS